jgi:PAS domain-containing protein
MVKDEGEGRPSLRARAEKLVERGTVSLGDLSSNELASLFHELQVHQIELKMQNEELRSAQEELERSRTKYFSLFDLAPVGYLTLDRTGLILEANRKVGDLLGLPGVRQGGSASGRIRHRPGHNGAKASGAGSRAEPPAIRAASRGSTASKRPGR